MTGRYQPIEPFRTGTLDVGDGHRLYWEESGDPIGKAAVVLHGGPGSGCAPWQRRLFDPSAYRIVLFDQRNCGRSTPHASEPDVDLSANTTLHLLEDIELLRSHLGIDRWLVLGGSWGSLLALAYAERHPERVSELLVFGVATGRRSEDDWLFRGGVGAFFPQQWERLVGAVPPDRWRTDIVETYANLLFHPDPDVRSQAAFEWCLWESATPAWPPSTGLDERFREPAFALAFARIVTHYVQHDAWIEDGALLQKADRIGEIPGVIVNGRFDFQSPLGSAWALHRAWPRAEFVVVEDAGHDASASGITDALVRATDAFASR
jgi:proline iminopeptidase